MHSALLLVVLMSPFVDAPTTGAFENAARDVLGAEADLQFSTSESLPSDDQALMNAPDADGVVELRWSQDQRQVTLHCYIRSQARWVDRGFSFDPQDRDEERGRLLGLAVASMFLEQRPQEPATSTEAGAQSTTPKPLSTAAAASPQDVHLSESVARPDAARPAAQGRRIRSELAALVSSGIGGTAGSVGAVVGFGIPASATLDWRFSLSGRAGEIPSAQASTRYLQLGSGLNWSPLSKKSWADFGLRTEVLVSWLELSHLSPDDEHPDRQRGWNVGAGFAGWAGVRASEAVTLYAASGLEWMAAEGDVSTHDVIVATIPRLRFIAELGFRTQL